MSHGNGADDIDAQSEQGLFTQVPVAETGAPAGWGRVSEAGEGLVRDAAPASAIWGVAGRSVDRRKYQYDVARAKKQPAIKFGATKADRLDAAVAGEKLHAIHVMYGIDKEDEARIHAFDSALWFEHAINGASMLQPGRGVLRVGEVQFDTTLIKTYLGEDQRRFFRAYADDIAACVRGILESYDPMDHESHEKVGQIRQVAMQRGLQKFPHLIHDSSDACVDITMEERGALLVSKRVTLPGAANMVDAVYGGASGVDAGKAQVKPAHSGFPSPVA